MFRKLFIVSMVVALLLTACGATATPDPRIDPMMTTIAQQSELLAQLNATQTPSPIIPTAGPVDPATPTADPATAATLSAPADPYAGWVQVQIGADSKFIPIEGQMWELVLATKYKTFLGNGSYEGVVPAEGDHADWPPHLMICRVFVQQGSTLRPYMDIATRIVVDNPSASAQKLRYTCRFNPERTLDEQSDDYDVAATQGDLGFFMSTEKGLMMPGTVLFEGKSSLIGNGCWNCTAHTYGPEDPAPVVLSDPAIGWFGTPGQPTSNSVWPALVIPIPHPENDPSYILDVEITVEALTSHRYWYGRYDVKP